MNLTKNLPTGVTLIKFVNRLDFESLELLFIQSGVEGPSQLPLHNKQKKEADALSWTHNTGLVVKNVFPVVAAA